MENKEEKFNYDYDPDIDNIEDKLKDYAVEKNKLFINLRLKNFHEEVQICIETKNFQRSKFCFENYYKEIFISIASSLVEICYKEKDLFGKDIISILSPYFENIAQKLDNICSYFESCHFIFKQDFTEQFYDNEYIFYLDNNDSLNFSYKDNTGQIITYQVIKVDPYNIKQLKKIKENNIDLKDRFKKKPYIIECLENYIKRATRQNDFDLPTIKSLASVKSALIKFQTAIINNFKVLILRVKNDIDTTIGPIFFSTSSSNKLTGIIPTGSDLHNRANQVFILEFINIKHLNSKNMKIIYKPSPVQADIRLFGYIEKIKKFIDKYKKCNSFAEIMNLELDEYDKLPTYMIIPCEDKNGFYEVTNHYGYIEYITREPKFGNKEKLKFKAEIKTGGEYVLQEEDPERLNYYIKQYSRRTGLWIAFMLATGLVDSHDDNIISKIVNKMDSLMMYRYLLDGKISFSILERTIENTSSCILGSGSFSPILEKYYHFKQNVILVSNHEGIFPLPVKKEHVIAGIKDGFEAIKCQAKNISNWMHILAKQQIFIRIVPNATGQLLRINDDIYRSCFDRKKSHELCKEEFKQFLLYDPYKTRFIIYIEPNNDLFIEEAMYLSLPTCYVKINENKLFLSNGKICVIPSKNKFLKYIENNFNSIEYSDIIETADSKNTIENYFLSKNYDYDHEEYLMETLFDNEMKVLTNIYLGKLSISDSDYDNLDSIVQKEESIVSPEHSDEHSRNCITM
jgi:hypothetical protein